MVRALVLLLLVASTVAVDAQSPSPPKVEHAEPLFIDLIRDLGARKGEREWNIGFGLTDHQRYDRYEALVEYEWAPIDRLGLEIEVPLTYFPRASNGTAPSNRIEGLKTAAQWSFLVSERHQTSLALGYLNELVFTDLDQVGARPFVAGNVYNPFVVAAKRLSSQWHSLVYTGPSIEQRFGGGSHLTYELNTSVHYMVRESRNFVGVEVNQGWRGRDFDMTIRPQMRLQINDQLLLGIVTGIPVQRESQRLSMFLRAIYEPRHR